MEKLTRQQLKTIFKKVKRFRLPKELDDIDFSKLKFFGWTDQTDNVAYTVLDYKGRLEGIRWEITRLTHVPLSPAFCEVCRKHRSRSEIMLVSAPTKKLPKGVSYQTRGNYICYNLFRCAEEAKEITALENLYQGILEKE